MRTPRAPRGVRAFVPAYEVLVDRRATGAPMQSEPRRTHDIDSLTDVALEVFARRGFDGASMEDVARAAGVTKAAIYHHVAGKEALLERGLRRALDALFAILDEPGATTGRSAARLRYIVRRVADTTLALLPEVSVLFRVRGNSAVEMDAIERRRRFDHLVGGLIAAAQREGDVRAELEPHLVSRLVFGLSNSVVEWYQPGRPIGPAQIVDTVEAIVFAGLSAPGNERHPA
jgi:AcrR family transcriptional regulator